jgi:hypothetical protein
MYAHNYKTFFKTHKVTLFSSIFTHFNRFLINIFKPFSYFCKLTYFCFHINQSQIE